MVSLQSEGGSHYCGGTLIAPNWVMTAAHCGAGEWVEIGLHSRSADDPCVERFRVVETRFHPQYDNNVDNDIALFRLSGNSKYPVATPYLGTSDVDAVGSMATLAGWGTMFSGGSVVDTLRKVDVPIQSNADCRSQYGGSIDDDVICAGFVDGGKDSCQGDSGGPMFRQVGGTTQVVGIVSWGQGCAQANFFGVYTRVSRYTDFICETTGVCGQPTPQPTKRPTKEPTTRTPTTAPSTGPPTTKKPTSAPTTAKPTTKKPTSAPTTAAPTAPCTLSADKLSYNGKVTKTVTGITCQNWSTDSPHILNYRPPEGDRDHTYCRNPDKDPAGPWCYTSDPTIRWQYCNVGTPDAPLCSDSDLPPPPPTPEPTPQPTVDTSCIPSLSSVPISRIVGGTEAQTREFPFMVSLQSEGGSHYCGGTLIAPNWVMTAAHCGAGEWVEIGLHSRSADDPCVERFRVVETRFHPQYDNNVDNDIALFRLSGNSKYPVATPYLGTSDVDAVGSMATLAGWGTMFSGGSVVDTLRKVDVPIQSNADCRSQYGGSIDDDVICAGFVDGGKDSCQGDSGGPMFRQVGGTTQVVGIVSWGQGCAQANFFGVYTRVSRYTDFICETTGVCGQPTPQPTKRPTKEPTTKEPTKAPTKAPTKEPTTKKPTSAPTTEPTQAPTKVPTDAPTLAPTLQPTAQPTKVPTSTPTEAPTKVPTDAPTLAPTSAPTPDPTAAPTSAPTDQPTSTPTANPTNAPTSVPTAFTQTVDLSVRLALPSRRRRLLTLEDDVQSALALSLDADAADIDIVSMEVYSDNPPTYDVDFVLTMRGDSLEQVQDAVQSAQVTVTSDTFEVPGFVVIPVTSAPSAAPTPAPTAAPTPVPTGAPTPTPTKSPTYDSSPTDCTLSEDGYQYDGEVSMTISGRTCMVWSASDPWPAKWLNTTNHNFCRNPDQDPGGPWCYTTDPNKKWEYCDVGTPANPLCSDGATQAPTPVPTDMPTITPTIAPTAAPEDGTFDFSGCGGGSGEFTVTLRTPRERQSLGVIPGQRGGVYVSLSAIRDLDVQVHDLADTSEFEEGRAIVAWCGSTGCNRGLLDGPRLETVTYKGMEVEYSGYNGVNGQKGNEYITLDGDTPNDLAVGVLAYRTGTATVQYSWETTNTPCCLGEEACGGDFTAAIAYRDYVTIGEIPTGVLDLKIYLRADSDVDIQLYDADNTTVWREGQAIIAYCKISDTGCNRGILGNSKDHETAVYQGLEYEYSGFNGDQEGNKGHEYIYINGKTNRNLVMKAFGYQAGRATVEYSYWEVVSDRQAGNA